RIYGHFLHFTDFHPDRHYLPGASVKQLCHRMGKKDWMLDDDQSNAAGTLGTPLTKCDSPWSLINGTVDWVARELVNKQGIDFVVWTGDSARHDSDTRIPRILSHIHASNRLAAELLLEKLPGIPIVPTIGNNDVYPHNLMEIGPNINLRGLLKAWHELIPEDQVHTFLEGKCGYFVREVIPDRLAVISLNTMFFYISNRIVDGCQKKSDPGSIQLIWLEHRLHELASRNMTAYVIGHVAPAALNYHPRCLKRYARLMRDWSGYPTVVLGQMFGHSNVDHFF
ncbi:Metallo-dependent phosphatase-like protein, partial [Thamnocephalis sphaerospora]